jgi:tetraacyldisaccharide-1-P 4'-kinase
MAERALLEDLWYGESTGARTGRALAVPASKLFGAVVGARDLMYEAGWLRTHATPIPVVSVGNLTVGGTGKTPIAAWVARELAARGAHPAVVLRGYGDDEPLVHSAVNPSIPVVTSADRVAGVERAAELGASIAVLDDAFQHRRVRRAADLVLVSADRWTPSVRLLPAGPWREPLSAARRATLVIVTRKAASEASVDAVNEAMARAAPSVPCRRRGHSRRSPELAYTRSSRSPTRVPSYANSRPSVRASGHQCFSIIMHSRTPNRRASRACSATESGWCARSRTRSSSRRVGLALRRHCGMFLSG